MIRWIRSPLPPRGLTELNAAGVDKCQKDLLYDYLHKIRAPPRRGLARSAISNKSFEGWKAGEAALVVCEITLRKDANKALEASYNTAEARGSSPKIKDKRKKKGGE